jgi:fatty-acyl-CoA synthase
VIEFGELPKTSTGKIQKFVLRAREWQGHDRRIH